MNNILHRKCNDLRRWKAEFWGGWSIRLHHWVEGDPHNYQHSHPWHFVTIVLWGGYDDVADGRSADHVRGPTIRYRPMSWRHSVINVKPRTWSIVITGPKLRPWRFWIDDNEVDRKTWDGRICD